MRISDWSSDVCSSDLGHVITGTDVDQRTALILLSNQATQVPAEELQRLRAQVLRNLVDETLQIQAAEAADIKVEQSEIDQYFAQYALGQASCRESVCQYGEVSGGAESLLKTNQ